MKRLIFVTGRPGIGKTSVLLRAVSALKRRGYEIGGMVSREFCEGGVRVGFEIVDFSTGKRGWLAHVNQPVGPRVSKYRVNLNDLNTIGVNAVVGAVTNADIVVVDEIGPMELFSPTFKEAVSQVMRSNKPMLGIIHYRTRNSLITDIKARKDAEILKVTYKNRASLHNLIVNKVVRYLQRPP